MKKIQLLLVLLVVALMVLSAQAITLTHVRTIGTVDKLEMIKDYSIAMDSSYRGSGGETLTAATLGFTTVYSAQCAPNGGYVFEYDIATAELKAYWTSNSVDGEVMPEVTATTDMSAITALLCRFTGK